MIAVRFWRRPAVPGEQALAAALVPWERQLALEALGCWLIRGAVASLAVAILVMLVGWFVPQPEAELRPLAFELALAPLVAGALVGLWPRGRLGHSADLDTRLRFGDRLTTAWLLRGSEEPVARLQRADAISRLAMRVARAELMWRPARRELIVLGGVAFVALVLLTAPSPQQAVLDQQVAEQLAIDTASQRLESLRDDPTIAAALTPEQLQQLDDLLRQAQAELGRTRGQQAAADVLARAQDQLASMADPNADLRDEALAAMSETLAAEPQTQALGAALQREDAAGASDALRDLAAKTDQLSDVERQALSRALQRASNIGRGDPRASSSLRDAAQAIASGNSASAALSASDTALRDAIQSSQANASVNSTLQRLRDLQSQLASGKPLRPETSGTDRAQAVASSGIAVASGTPVALNGSGGYGVRDPAAGQGGGAGVGAGGSEGQGQGASTVVPAENVFVPGRAGNGPADQDLVDTPFTLRGAPRPYRDVLSQYAQSSRDYVDRPDISPAVRDLVKQYFQSLEDGQ